MYSASEASKILGKDVTQDSLVFDSPVLPDPRVIFVYDNPDFIPHFKGKYDTCNVIVHPSFSLVKGHIPTGIEHNVGEYGSYREYLRNLNNLSSALRMPRTLNLFVYDEHCFSGEDKYLAKILPSVSDLILVTGSDNVYYKTQLEKKDHKIVNLKQERICPFLKSIGIKRVRFAGEWVWKWVWSAKKGGAINYMCVTVIAENFQKHFEVSGIKGCLYPSEPSFASDLLMKLYQDYPKPNKPSLKTFIRGHFPME